MPRSRQQFARQGAASATSSGHRAFDAMHSGHSAAAPRCFAVTPDPRLPPIDDHGTSWQQPRRQGCRSGGGAACRWRVCFHSLLVHPVSSELASQGQLAGIASTTYLTRGLCQLRHPGLQQLGLRAATESELANTSDTPAAQLERPPPFLTFTGAPDGQGGQLDGDPDSARSIPKQW